MDNKEKYYNFIVGDLLKKTDIDYEYEKFTFPFTKVKWRITIELKEIINTQFYNYVTQTYGVQDYDSEKRGDNEADIIWYLYKERLEDIVRNHE